MGRNQLRKSVEDAPADRHVSYSWGRINPSYWKKVQSMRRRFLPVRLAKGKNELEISFRWKKILLPQTLTRTLHERLGKVQFKYLYSLPSKDGKHLFIFRTFYLPEAKGQPGRGGILQVLATAWRGKTAEEMQVGYYSTGVVNGKATTPSYIEVKTEKGHADIPATFRNQGLATLLDWSMLFQAQQHGLTRNTEGILKDDAAINFAKFRGHHPIGEESISIVKVERPILPAIWPSKKKKG